MHTAATESVTRANASATESSHGWDVDITQGVPNTGEAATREISSSDCFALFALMNKSRAAKQRNSAADSSVVEFLSPPRGKDVALMVTATQAPVC